MHTRTGKSSKRIDAATITARLRALLQDGPCDEQLVDDLVLLDRVDAMVRRDQPVRLQPAEQLRLSALIGSDEVEFMYFLVARGKPQVKIGTTAKRPDVSLATIQSLTSVRVERVALLRCPLGYEGLLHRALQPHVSHGTWFHLNDSVISLMADVRVRRFRAIHEFVWQKGLYNVARVG